MFECVRKLEIINYNMNFLCMYKCSEQRSSSIIEENKLIFFKNKIILIYIINMINCSRIK